MKLLLISDIHGSFYYAKKAIEAYEKEKADYIVILGDELYHGPRNPLPREYNPMEVAQLFNKYADKIIAVRGNCDSEVDELVIDYPIRADFSTILYEGRRLFLTHGHVYSPDNMPKLSDGDVFIFGHIHTPIAEKRGSIYIINPGSTSLPKESYPNSYGVLEGNDFEIKDFDGNVFKRIDLE